MKAFLGIVVVKGILAKLLTEITAAPLPLAKARILCALNVTLDTNAKRIKQLKDRHCGQRAFIIGNGPSLQMSDLERLTKEITFASNKIFLAFPKVQWRPTYHFVESDKVLEYSMDILKCLDHEDQLFLSTDALQFGPRFENAIYYHRDFHTNPHNPPFQTRPLGHAHMGYSVLYTCLQFAFYMGIKEVYLLGVDQAYIRPPVKAHSESGTAIYESLGEVNHFDPDYKQPGEEWYDPNLLYQQAGFKKAGQVYRMHGRSIKNATRGGNLEVFERVDFDSLFK